MLPTPFRTSVTALLLLVQVLGLTHLAAADHALGEGGVVVEASLLPGDAHDEAGDHICAGEAQLRAEGAEDCLVLAGWATPSLVAPVALGVALHLTAQGTARSSAQVAPQLEVLARAPKGSPPLG